MTGHELIPVTIAGAFTFGVILALLGSIKLPLAKRLGIDETRVGGLLAAFNLALIPMMLISGILIDQLGVRWMLVAGSLVTGLAMMSLAMSQTYFASLYSILLVGGGGACISTAAIKLMPRAFFGETHQPAASLNLGNVFFGLGALVTPTLADLLMRFLGFRRTMSLLGVICLVPAALAIITPGQEFVFPRMEAGDLGSVLANPTLWLAGLVFLLYSPLEGALGTWTTTYLTEMGFRERRAALLLSGFWLAFLGSRLLAGLLQQSVLTGNSEPWVIVFLAVVGAVVLGNLASTRHGASSRAAWGILAVGAILGPIFPTLVGLLFKQFPVPVHGTAYGAMFAIGATGSLVLAPLIGASARRKSVRHALRIPTVVSLVLAAAALVLGMTLYLFL
jgi:fucose permease